MIQGVNPAQSSSLPPVVPVAPAAPPAPTPTAPPVPLEVDLQPFLESTASVGAAPSAGMAANQLNFDRLSSHILAQVASQPADGHLSLPMVTSTCAWGIKPWKSRWQSSTRPR